MHMAQTGYEDFLKKKQQKKPHNNKNEKAQGFQGLSKALQACNRSPTLHSQFICFVRM